MPGSSRPRTPTLHGSNEVKEEAVSGGLVQKLTHCISEMEGGEKEGVRSKPVAT